MLILVFDTSMKNGTVGWVQLDESPDGVNVVDYANMFMPAVPGHAERLLDRIEFCLQSGGYKIGDVDLIVLGEGPGTFTGLRIGFSTAKAFCLANQIPMVLLSTLEILACNAHMEGQAVAMLDARRKEVYIGAFDIVCSQTPPQQWCATPIMTQCVAAPGEVEEILQQNGVRFPVQLVGDGAIAYAETFSSFGKRASMSSIGLDSYTMALRGYDIFKTEGPCNVAAAEPVYLREPDAKKPKVPFGS